MAPLCRVGAVYIGLIMISPATEVKIQSKHGITPDEVREACSAPIASGWHTDQVKGRRLLLTGRTAGGRLLKVVLQPVDVRDGTWSLRTALVAKSKRSR